jgi:hypothetical protein
MDLALFSSLCSSEPYMPSSSLTDMMFLGDDMSYAMYALSQPFVPPLPPTIISTSAETSGDANNTVTTITTTTTTTGSASEASEEAPLVLPQRFELDVDPNVYNVEAILAHKNRPGGRKYLVKWEGWDSRYCSWISASDFCTDALPNAYEEELKVQREARRRAVTSDATPPTPPRARAPKRRSAPAAVVVIDRGLERACKRQRV